MTNDFATTVQTAADNALERLREAKADLAETAENVRAGMLQSKVERIAHLEGYADAAVTIARNAEEVGEERKVKYMTRKLVDGYAGGLHPTQAAARTEFQEGYRAACANLLDM